MRQPKLQEVMMSSISETGPTTYQPRDQSHFSPSLDKLQSPGKQIESQTSPQKKPESLEDFVDNLPKYYTNKDDLKESHNAILLFANENKIFGETHPTSARHSWVKLSSISSIHFRQLKESIYDCLNESLENDRCSINEAPGLVLTMIELTGRLKTEIIQTEHLPIIQKLARSIAYTAILIFRQCKDGPIPAIDTDLKKEALVSIEDSLINMNKKRDIDTKYLSVLALEAIKRVRTQDTTKNKLFTALSNIVAIGFAYNDNDWETIVSKVKETYQSVINEMTSDWFNAVLAIEESAKSNPDNYVQFTTVQVLANNQKINAWRFHARAAEILAWYALNTSNPEIRHQALFGPTSTTAPLSERRFSLHRSQRRQNPPIFMG